MKERDREVTDDEAEEDEETDKKDGDAEAVRERIFFTNICFITVIQN